MKTFADEDALKRRIKRIARRLSLAYMSVVRVPNESHSIQYELLGSWFYLSNLGNGTIESTACVLIKILRGQYGRLARTHSDCKLSKCFDRVDARLKILEAAARLFCDR